MDHESFSEAVDSRQPVPTTSADFEAGKGVVVHHVFFWLKNPADAEALIVGLRKLAAIPQVKKLLIGRPASTLIREVVDNSYQVSELMYFSSTADQDAYQAHPLHLEFVDAHKHLWERVVVYDMVVE